MLVSFTADAGQEIPAGASRAPLSAKYAAVMPPNSRRRRTRWQPPSAAIPAAACCTRRALPSARRNNSTACAGRDRAARVTSKKTRKIFPEIDRSHKGDPLVGLRPTLDGRLAPERRAGENARRISSPSARTKAASPPVLRKVRPARIVADLKPGPKAKAPVTQPSRAVRFAEPGAGVLTMRRAALAERIEQGATPAQPRAVALGLRRPPSATRPRSRFWLPLSPRRPRRAPPSATSATISALIPPEQLECGKALPRPGDLFRGAQRTGGRTGRRRPGHPQPHDVRPLSLDHLRRRVPEPPAYHGCQFSFACEGKSLRIIEGESWAQATRIADDVLDGTDLDGRCRRRDALSRQLRPAALGARADKNGRDRAGTSSTASNRSDVKDRPRNSETGLGAHDARLSPPPARLSAPRMGECLIPPVRARSCA